jgi:hypothetical protein
MKGLPGVDMSDAAVGSCDWLAHDVASMAQQAAANIVVGFFILVVYWFWPQR